MIVNLLPKTMVRFACLWILNVSSASADLTIVGNFTGGTTPPNAVGGGSLTDVFNAAADWWEMAIVDDHTVTIDFSWGPLRSSVLGETRVEAPVPFTSATIVFDNDSSNKFFVDPTPHNNSEWKTFTESTDNLGGGTVNTGRVFTDPMGEAIGNFDLLTVAKHEIGHALGLINFPAAGAGLLDPLVISAPLPNPGTVLQTVTTGGGHLDLIAHPGALMTPTLLPGERKLPSGIDILATAENVGFTSVNLNPSHIPEPTPVYALSTICVCLTGWSVWKKRGSI